MGKLYLMYPVFPFLAAVKPTSDEEIIKCVETRLAHAFYLASELVSYTFCKPLVAQKLLILPYRALLIAFRFAERATANWLDRGGRRILRESDNCVWCAITASYWSCGVGGVGCWCNPRGSAQNQGGA